MTLAFAAEPAALVADEVLGLAVDHNAEAGFLSSEHLDVNVEGYVAAEAAGVLEVFTARDPAGAIVGYSVFVRSRHMHYGIPIASQDALYMARPWRRHSLEFMAWTDQQLFARGVERIFRSSTSRAPYGIVLERMGYERDAVLYVRTAPKR